MIQVVIKPTTNCNLNCLYCNVEQKSRDRISTDVVKSFMKLLSDWYPHHAILVRWHGGEPLLMGKRFFTDVLRWQKSLSTQFENEISSNLTLLDNEYLSLFKQNDIAIYTSLDAVGASHDSQRHNSFERVRESLFKLRDYGIKKVTVRSTATKSSVESLLGVYELCYSLGFRWDFSVVIPAGLQRVQALKLLVDPTEFARTAQTIFDSWLRLEPAVEVPLFRNIINYFLNREQYLHETQPRLSLGADGVIYQCPLLIGKREYAITEFGDSNRFNQFCSSNCSAERLHFSACENCYYEFFCKLTHCTYLAQVHNGFPTLPEYLCQCWKPLYLHIHESVSSLVLFNNHHNQKEISHEHQQESNFARERNRN